MRFTKLFPPMPRCSTACCWIGCPYLSEKNDWKDEHGRVYQYFTIHQAQELLHFGHEKVCRLFAELDAADLIERRRQGQGKANRIYLKEFTQKSDYRNSRSPGIGRK